MEATDKNTDLSGISIQLDGSAMVEDSGGRRDGKTSNSSLAPPPAPSGSSMLTVPAPGGVFPLPNSQQVAGGGGGSATGNPRNKVALKKGFSLMDWIRLTNSGKDLAGVGGKPIQVTKRELAKHNKRKDAWMAINGVVYNVTQYMDYHPGGWDELIKGAGKDATNLFNEVHRWVNYESMLSACLVGKLIDEQEEMAEEKKKSDDGFARPNSLPSTKPVIPPIKSTTQKPTFDFHQTSSSFVISIYTRNPDLSRENVIADLRRNKLTCLVLMPAKQLAYSLNLQFDDKDLGLDRVRVNSSGKIEIILAKSSGDKVDVTNSNDKLCDQAGLDVEYRDWTLIERTRVTHDVDLMILRPPEGLLFEVPVGHHIQMRAKVEGMDIARSYTPVIKSITDDDDDGQNSDGNLHFLIKTYDDGALTPKIKKLKIGDTIPVSNHTGSFTLTPEMLSDRTHFSLLAAGTGFTPMVKLIRRLVRNKTAKIRLVFFNKTEEDIIWREELDELQFKSGGSFKVDHVLSNQHSWSGFKGRISEEILGPLLISDAARCDRKFAAVCGPNQFTDKAKDVLTKIGYYGNEVILFQG